MTVSKGRIAKVDFIRGAAIILVICGHNIGLVMKGNLYGNIGQLLHSIIYTFHIPLLFMISGYVEYIGYHSGMESSKLSYTLMKDIISLYIPYLFLTYLYWAERLLADKLLGITLNDSVYLSIRETVKRLYTGDGASWFLLSLLLVKVVFDIMNRYEKETRTLFLFFALFWISFSNLKITEFLGWGIFYYIGYLINKYDVDKIKGGAKSILSIFCLNIMAVGYVFFSKYGVSFIVKFLVSIPMFILLMLCFEGTKERNIFKFCGRYSMIVYIVHGLGNYVCYMILSKVTRIPGVLLLLTISLQILISYVVFWLYSHIRWLHWLMFIFYPYKFLNLAKKVREE